MPSIIEISPSCPSSCALIGSASIMRDFLLAKNLPSVPSDVEIAGLSSEWYNDGDVATEYNNFDPGSLTNPGTVLDWGYGNIDEMRIKYKNANLYDDYETDHYQYGGYTEYPLLSIDDVNLTLNGFGNIQGWTDPDECLVISDTWDHKWTFELQNNRYYPGTSYIYSTLQDHSDYIVVDTDNPSITPNPYSVDQFYNDNDNTIYNHRVYYEMFLDPLNAYHSVNNGGYNNIPVGTTLMEYGYNLIIETNPVNSTNDNINDFTTPDGIQSPWEYITTAEGARNWLTDTKNKYYNDPTHVYQNILSSPSIQYTNETTGDNIIGNNDIDVFEVNNNDLSSNGIVQGSTFTPSGMIEYYCNTLNIYGGEGTPSNIYDFSTWLNFIQTQTLAGCTPYIKAVLSPAEYGIQTFKDTQDVNLNLLKEYLPPQSSIILYKDGSTLDLIDFGVTTDINTAIGNVLTTNPVPFDAILTVLDSKLDTPLGKYGRRKLASELFNRININLREEALGKAEQIATGIKDTIFGMFSKDKKGSDGIQEIIDAFRNFEITVPKTFIGKAANFIASIGGTNIKLDNPIKEPIRWTTNVEKTDEENVDDVDNLINNDTPSTSFWNSLTNKKNTDDPSSILLNYTSDGQISFIKSLINLNEYTPFYENIGMSLKSGEKIERKKNRLNRQIERLNDKISDKNKSIDLLQTDIGKMSSGNIPSDYVKSINRETSRRTSKGKEPESSCRQKAIADQICKLKHDLNNVQLDKTRLENKLSEKQKSLDELLYENPLPFYPTFDNGTFNSTEQNSQLRKQSDLKDSGLYQRSADNTKDFSETFTTTSPTENLTSNYKYPLDKTTTDKSRYSKKREDGLAPEDFTSSDKITTYDNLYYKVKDLLKHGVNPQQSEGKRTFSSGGRGLNIKDDTKFGYNVYPAAGKQSPGLGREEQYTDQSLFSVLEDNGYVKISPLYNTDKFKNVEETRDFVDKYNPYSSYKEMVTLHKYMFSIENLAWKGFSQNLTWWERGPNGGRILWFPPYDLKISDTSSASWGQENLIGRNEPIYTYNHSERSGVLSFKMVIDYPGYFQDYDDSKTDTTTVGSYISDSGQIISNGELAINPQSTNNNVNNVPLYTSSEYGIPQTYGESSTSNNIVPMNAGDTTELHYPDQIDKLIGWFKNMCTDNSFYNNNGDPTVPILVYTTYSEVSSSDFDKVVPTTDVYNTELLEWLQTGLNTNSPPLNPMRIKIGNVTVFAQYDYYTPLEFLQKIVVGNQGNYVNSEVTSNGKITARGWTYILKYFDPYNSNASTTSVDGNNDSTVPSDTPLTSPAGITNNNQTSTNRTTGWGTDVNTTYNPLNEFLYFKRLSQEDPIFVDTLKEKITYFDPAFHSISPVGFNNRLNFLEQCARQGPSINNTQSGNNIVASASNLAFGRPPISVLRIGDFYHTRIAIETLDISYEPFIWDTNPEGIGVQPMICDVSITFKYLGGSSLSGPITQLQNAISNNYFANVEVHTSQALKAFDRFKYPPGVNGETISDVETSSFLAAAASNQNLVFNGNVGSQIPQTDPSSTGDNNKPSEQDKINQNKPTTDGLYTKKDENKISVTNKCKLCPTGSVFTYTPDIPIKWVCASTSMLNNKNDYHVFIVQTCREYNKDEIYEGMKFYNTNIKNTNTKLGRATDAIIKQANEQCKKDGCI
jgi:chaperonin cofactor prefoldin